MDPAQQNNIFIDENMSTLPVIDSSQTVQVPPMQSGSSPQMPTVPISSTTPLTPPVQPSPAVPSVAEDVDLIEKEWVNKAKKIVDSTKNDPSQQNIQLNKFKAEYLKIRFNKDIKPMDG